MSTIAIANQKGGVGKSFTCISLGVALANEGKKVLMVDLDAQANLTMSLGHQMPDEIPVTVASIMEKYVKGHHVEPGEGIISHPEGVDFLPSNIHLSGMEVSLVSAMNRERVLKKYIDGVRKQYDYILIDCLPSLGLLNVNALTAADSVIIPAQAHFLSVKGLELLLHSIAEVKRELNPKLTVGGILVTMLDKRSNFTRDVVSLIREQYGKSLRVFDAEIPASIRAVESGAEGKSIHAYDPNGKVAAAYAALAKEVLRYAERERQRGQHQTTIQIPFDADKLDAIRQFMQPEKPSLEVEILALIEKIYTKTVPEPVRRFIEHRVPDGELQPSIRRKDRSASHEKVRGGDSGNTLVHRGSGGQQPAVSEGFSTATVSED